jgi:hypothetical protein
MQVHAVYQFHSHDQLITLDSICSFEYRKKSPFGSLPETRGGQYFRDCARVLRPYDRSPGGCGTTEGRTGRSIWTGG